MPIPSGDTIPTGPRCGPELPAHVTQAVDAAPSTPTTAAAADPCVTCGRVPGVPRPVPLHTVHCGPCWATYGGSPDAEEIDAPPLEALGSRDPVDQREWPARLAAEPWVQDRRRDCREKLLLLAR